MLPIMQMDFDKAWIMNIEENFQVRKFSNLEVNKGSIFKYFIVS